VTDGDAGSNSSPPGAGGAAAGHPATAVLRAPLGLRFLASVGRFWPFLLLAAIAFLGWEDLKKLDFAAVRTALHLLDPRWLGIAAGITAINLVLFGLYDLVALARTSVPPAARWRFGTLAFAWSNFLTLGPLAGPAIRIWLYAPYNLEAGALRGAVIATMISFATALGAVLVCVAVLPPLPAFAAAAVLLAIVAHLLGALEKAGIVPGWLKRGGGGWRALLAVALADWILAALAFAAVLNACRADILFGDALQGFFNGQAVGVVSLMPGGLGSADAYWLLRLPVEQATLAAALVSYRIIYYVIPWLIACLILLARGARTGARWLSPIPAVLGLLVAGAGAVMLVSTASPAVEHRMRTLSHWVPIGVVEVGHLFGALSGLGLLFLARGVMRGYREAHHLTVGILLAAALAAALKGLDYEEAVVLLALAAIVGSQGAQFRRSGRAPWVGWTAILLVALAIFIYAAVGFGSFSASAYEHATWGRFGFGPHADQVARFLRGLALLAIAGAGVLLYGGLRAAARFHAPDSEEIDRALASHAKSGQGTSAMMVAAGDKAIFFQNGDAFCIYRVVGSYLVVFGDPTTPPGDERPFLDALMEHADALDRRVLFYQLSAAWLPSLHDRGFSFFKLGEEAILPLTDFSLAGGRWKSFRHAVRRVEEKEGGRFVVLTPEEVAARLPELRRVSDEWLERQVGREKQFSVGAFSDEYMKRFPCAVVLNELDRVVAFANLLCGPNKGELSIDLMRSGRGAPDGVMDYLFASLLEWGHKEGFATFNFGVAPLAAVGDLSGARLWERLAHLLFRHGEGLYHFQGLRSYKAKFQPRWVPRYMAYGESWEWPFAVVQVSVLIAGGWRAVLRPGKASA
jgi:phosphatidylglycerol lysyltransferase